MANLFAYGTLMCSDIIAATSGFKLPSVSGTINGYRRLRVKGEDYPAIIMDESASVEGLLYMDLPEAGWKRLDRFEGEMYFRARVEVKSNNGEIIPAETYVTRREYFDLLLDDEWDFDEFLGKNKKRFEKSYKGYDALKAGN